MEVFTVLILSVYRKVVKLKYFSCKVPNLRANHHFLMKSIKVATFTSKVLVETPSTSGYFHTLTLLWMVKDHGSDGPLVRNCGGTL